MNIHNLDFVGRVYKSLEANKRQLHSIETFPQMVTLQYSGTDLGLAAKFAIIERLKDHYRQLIATGTKQLEELGVDLSPLPEPEDNEGEEE